MPLSEAGQSDIEYLEAANLALHRYGGCSTPAEEFIKGILFNYGNSGTLRLNMIESDLAEFRQNFDDMARDTALFVAVNPQFAPKPNEQTGHPGTKG